MKKFLKFYALVYVFAQIVFPIVALVLTSLSAAGWAKLVYNNDGTFRVWVSPPIGTPLYSHPYEGVAPTHITAGPVMLEVIKTLYGGFDYTNPEMRRTDFTDRHRACLRLSINPVDAVAFAAHRNCLWLRDPDGKTYTYLAGREKVIPEWERLTSLKEPDKKEFVLMPEPGLAGLDPVLALSPSIVTIVLLALAGLASLIRPARISPA